MSAIFVQKPVFLVEPHHAITEHFAQQEEVIANLKNLFSLYDASEGKREHVFAAYEKVYDKHVAALTSLKETCSDDMLNPEKRVHLDFESLFENVFWAMALNRTVLSKVSFEAPAGEKGVLHYFVQGEYMQGHIETVHLRAQTRNGKIVRLKREETTFLVHENLKILLSLKGGSIVAKLSAANE
jgi:hypothetical protein